MQLKRLPVSIIIGLGLIVENVGCGPCLNFWVPTTDDPGVSSTTAPGTSGASGTTGSTTSTTGTTAGTTGAETTTGPCLAPMPTTGAPETTGSGTDSDGTGSSTGDDQTTTGPCLAPPVDGDGVGPDEDGASLPTAASSSPRAGAVIERVLAASALPEDVVARLRERLISDDQ